jgi:hypothetical protein
MAHCAECGKEFERYRPWHRFCTEWCRAAWHRRRYAAMRRWWLEERGEQDEQEQAV